MQRKTNMGAFENIEQLKAILSECADENERIWNKPYDPSDEKQIIYRYNFYCDQIKELEEVAGDLIDFCKDFIEDNPKKNYDFYRNEVFEPLNKILDGRRMTTLWHRSNELLLWYYDKVKIYERQERNGDCIYVWDKEDQLWNKPKGSDLFYLMSNYQNQNHALFEYCRLRESFEYKLLSLLCHYKESNKGNVNIDYARQLIVFAHTVCLFTVMHNERKQVLKDAKYARLNLEELQTTAPEPQGKAKAKKKTKQPREVFTERAKKYFAKAEEAGYMEKVGEQYKWLYHGGTVALVYFFIRIYEPESPPYEQLEPVFGVKNLTSSRSNLVKSTWYKHELKRQKMSPEELKLEERMQKLVKPSSWFPELKNFFD